MLILTHKIQGATKYTNNHSQHQQALMRPSVKIVQEGVLEGICPFLTDMYYMAAHVFLHPLISPLILSIVYKCIT